MTARSHSRSRRKQKRRSRIRMAARDRRLARLHQKGRK